MNKVNGTCVVVTAIICLVSGSGFAQTLRDTDYFTLEAGTFVSGDKLINDIFGPHLDAFGALNKMLTDNFSVLGKVEGIYGEGSKSGIDLTRSGLKAGLSLVGLLMPGKPVDPYVLAGGLFEYNRVTASAGGADENDSDSEFGFEIGGGIEFNLEPKTLLDLGVLYQKFSDFDSIYANARIGYALTTSVTLLLEGGYAFDEEDYYARAGIAVKY